MLPKPTNYSVWPGVVRADMSSEMTIVPSEKAFLMFEGDKYRVTIISIDDDETSYYEPTTAHTVTAVAHDGVLRFSYVFPGEQAHLIMLWRGENKLQDMYVYSLRDDLYGLRPMKGDLHSHSFRSDGKRDPAALAGHYREQGYDFFALTDHNRFYPGGEIDETYAGVNMGLHRVTGEEVHAPGSVVHIIHVGGKSSVADIYVHDRPRFEAEVMEYMAKVPAHIPAQYHERYAKAMWAADAIHAAGGLAIFPHPYWRPGKSMVYNVRDEFAVMLLESGMFDAFELAGGMKHAGINRAVALWADVRSAGTPINVVGSSDVHGIENAYTFPHLFTVCFAESASDAAIISAIKAGRSVAVEAEGSDYARQYRCYGSLRMVSYAQFLLENYFPRQQRICQGEGVAMRAYAIGESGAELIELQARQTENFRRRFFGELPPALPTPDMLAFEEKWRAVQCQGPLTRGSGLSAPPVTRQL